MILSAEANTFFAVSHYEEREALKQAGFRWNPDRKRWETADPSVASRVVRCADEKAQLLLETVARTRAESIEASRKRDSDFNPPCPEGLTYMPFQRAGVAYGLSHPNVLLGSEMGLGKTVEALGIINSLPENETKKILIIVPASLKINWLRESKRWLVHPRTIGVADSKDFPDTSMVIINYDILKNHYSSVHKQEWDVLVVDECHMIKTPRARRTFEVLGGKEKKKKKQKKEEMSATEKEAEAAAAIIEGLCLFVRVTEHPPIPARRKIFLSGTPLMNRPSEIWGIAHALAPNEFPDFWKFAMKFCAGHKTHFGWDFSGASSLGELNEKLRASCMIRRLKSEVLKELPPKTRQIIPLDPEGCMDILKAERASYDQHAEEIEQARSEVEIAKASDNEGEYKSAVGKLMKANQTAFTEMARVRHETALAKVPQVVEHVLVCLEEEQKIIVFAHHHDVISAIVLAVGKDQCVKLTGEMKIEDRQVSVDRFQTDPTCRVFVGSIKAAGLGITLTAASHVIFAELDWVPSSISQAEDRSHRLGTTKNVLIQHLVFDGSLDADMAKTLVAKQAVIDKALGDDGLDLEIAVEPSATDNVSRKMVAREAVSLTPEQVATIHQSLKMLAGRCDGARSQDGAGFNKADSRVGHSLAEQSYLTPKQAVLGKRICVKYRRQLREEVLNVISPKKDETENY